MTKEDFNDGLMGFLDASPTPFHATKNMADMFLNAGFTKIYEEQNWNLKDGQKYFLTRNDSSIIAFTYSSQGAYTIIGAHTDSPNLKLKPNPLAKEHGVSKLLVEPYGGALLSTWFDRELSLAGRISYLSNDNILKDALIKIEQPVAMTPSLAIHLDPNANTQKSINKQTDLSPIISTDENFDLNLFLLKHCQVDDIKNIYSHELSLYPTQKASYFGAQNEFIASARLDNLLSCYIGMLVVCSVETPVLFVANDHEEVGSVSSSGAEGSFLQNTLQRAANDYEKFIQTCRRSLMVSLDNAHAIHPNFPFMHDLAHAPKLGGGVVVKSNSNQKYASNSKTIARFLNVASSLGEKTQNFVSRSDIGCGSTIGPITAAKLGIAVLDLGVPTLAMHSARECCHSNDALGAYNIILGLCE